MDYTRAADARYRARAAQSGKDGLHATRRQISAKVIRIRSGREFKLLPACSRYYRVRWSRLSLSNSHPVRAHGTHPKSTQCSAVEFERRRRYERGASERIARRCGSSAVSPLRRTPAAAKQKRNEDKGKNETEISAVDSAFSDNGIAQLA